MGKENTFVPFVGYAASRNIPSNNSTGYLRKLIHIILLIFSSGIIFAQKDEVKNFDEVIVTAGKTPLLYSNLARSIILIDQKEIGNTPANNILDLLKSIGGLDVKTRGAEGVQSDIAIRGGTFEQTLVLLDGLKISDSQTGHHNFNLSIPLESIEKIEILKGQGSRIFGPNTFSGAVNIVTKKNNTASFSLSALTGEHNLWETSIYGSYPAGIISSSFSFAKKKSDGYRANTDFDITTFSVQQNARFDKAGANLFFAFTDKIFGANSFYSDMFPYQWEHTTTKFFSASGDFNITPVSLSSKFYWRRNDDDFSLDHNRPDWNRNIHQTNSYGIEVQSSFTTSLGISSAGFEANSDEIASTNLGDHTRNKGGVFFEHIFNPGDAFSSSFGFFAYNYSNIGWKFWPGIDLLYKINSNYKIFASSGKAFRIPSFTDLYYKSPANLGNPNLVHEETINYEIGLTAQFKNILLELNLFRKDGTNLIDWVRLNKESPWQVQNITKTKNYGGEINLAADLENLFKGQPVKKISVGYTYLYADRTTDNFESKYLLDHLEHQLLINFSNKLPLGITQSSSVRYEIRKNYNSHFTIDTQLKKEFGDFELLARIANLFNNTYSDFTGVPVPGRWISAGVKYRYNSAGNL